MTRISRQARQVTTLMSVSGQKTKQKSEDSVSNVDM